MWEILQAILIAVITAVITVKLSLKKYQSEKWWEKKAETYSRIIDALHKLKNYSEQKLSSEFREINLSHEDEEKLSKQYKAAYSELLRVLDIGSFIISEKSIQLLESYKNRPQLNWGENPIWDIIQDDIDKTKECLKQFKQLAKHDLGVK